MLKLKVFWNLETAKPFILLGTLFLVPPFHLLTISSLLYRGIVAGLKELHKHGFMHRSLKPSNVILGYPDPSTSARRVVLRDYGFNQIKDAILKAGQAPNPYLAPELTQTTPEYSKSIDTFAFGTH